MFLTCNGFGSREKPPSLQRKLLFSKHTKLSPTQLEDERSPLRIQVCSSHPEGPSGAPIGWPAPALPESVLIIVRLCCGWDAFGCSPPSSTACPCCGFLVAPCGIRRPLLRALVFNFCVCLGGMRPKYAHYPSSSSLLLFSFSLLLFFSLFFLPLPGRVRTLTLSFFLFLSRSFSPSSLSSQASCDALNTHSQFLSFFLLFPFFSFSFSFCPTSCSSSSSV